MEKAELKKALLSLSLWERKALLSEIEKETSLHIPILSKRRDLFNNKAGVCPYCNSKKYRKHGIDKGCQRYYCKECKRTFTEYTGTWLSGIHKKELIGDYMKLMEKELSLDKIKKALRINKKTAFDWRHKVLSGYERIDTGLFKGITESDDTFFLESSKGKKVTDRDPRKRGGKASHRGISDEQVAVIVTADRGSEVDLSVATLGRIKKIDIVRAIGDRVSGETILCSDSHVSYKGFALDKKIEHHAIRANLKEYVKQKIYHVQHVNSIDSRLKKWLEYQFNGVSTKYLQKYLNWFKAKEKLKSSNNFLLEFTEKSLESNYSKATYRKISIEYDKLMQITTHN
jgi:transposase-like protein